MSHGSFGGDLFKLFQLKHTQNKHTNKSVLLSSHLCYTYCLRIHFASHESQQIRVSHCNCTICLLICKIEWTMKIQTERWNSNKSCNCRQNPLVLQVSKMVSEVHTNKSHYKNTSKRSPNNQQASVPPVAKTIPMLKKGGSFWKVLRKFITSTEIITYL